MILFFDTETTDKYNYKKGLSDPSQPHLLSIAMIGYDDQARAGDPEIYSYYAVVKPEGFTVPKEVEKINGWTQEKCERLGQPVTPIVAEFLRVFKLATYVVSFNVRFDAAMINVEAYRARLRGLEGQEGKLRCAMLAAAQWLKIPNEYHYAGRTDWKWPKLGDAFQAMYQTEMANAHHAYHDTRNLAFLTLDMYHQEIWDLAADRVLV